MNTFSLGYIQQWANNYPDAPYIDFIKNLSIDLKDGYLDLKKINGDKTDLISLLEPSPNNIDPEKNNAKDIGDNQKNIRTEFEVH